MGRYETSPLFLKTTVFKNKGDGWLCEYGQIIDILFYPILLYMLFRLPTAIKVFAWL